MEGRRVKGREQGRGRAQGRWGRQGGWEEGGRKKGAQREGGEAEDELGNAVRAEQSWREGTWV